MSIKTYFQYLFHEIIDNVGMKQQRQQKQTLRDKKARLLVGSVNLLKKYTNKLSETKGESRLFSLL